MPDTLTLHAADALRTLADVLGKHPDLPSPIYLTVSPRPDGRTPHAGMQFGSYRTPRENVAAVAAWADALGTSVIGSGTEATVDGIRVTAYHPEYTPADLDEDSAHR